MVVLVAHHMTQRVRPPTCVLVVLLAHHMTRVRPPTCVLVVLLAHHMMQRVGHPPVCMLFWVHLVIKEVLDCLGLLRPLWPAGAAVVGGLSDRGHVGAVGEHGCALVASSSSVMGAAASQAAHRVHRGGGVSGEARGGEGGGGAVMLHVR